MTGIIVHEWIAPHGGSENVLEQMVAAFPEARLHCLWNDAPDRFPHATESWLAHTPLRRSKAAALPVLPATWRHTRTDDYDWVLVSSHQFAHQVGGPVHPGGPPKFVYVHTPARYIWAPDDDARGNHPVARLLAPSLRRLDRRRAGEGARFAANSAFVRDRIRQAWGQESEVIHPPVRVDLLQSVSRWADTLGPEDAATLGALPLEFVLGASRFVDYKRLDLVVRTGEALGLPVVLAGAGPQRQELAALGAQARVPVTIVDRPSDGLLFALMQAAALFVFPPVEDFGIMPVEAMALGTPVLVGARGGSRESVDALGGGAVFESSDPVELARAADTARRADAAAAARSAGEAFGEPVFRKRLTAWMSSQL
ncbi:MAG: glycosyltransferase [Rhodoglobus sp.]|nr:glycosyltransferase [Rhodoglobus sp.]